MTSDNQPVNPAQAIQTGMEHLQAGRLPQAEAIFRQMLAADDTNHLVLGLLGCIAHKTGKHKQALGYFNQALQHNSKDPFLHFNLGIALAEQGRLEEALAHNPRYAEAHNILGSVFQEQSDVNQALQHFRRALQLDPRYAKAQWNLSLLLLLQGDLAEGLAHYEKRFEGLNSNEVMKARSTLARLTAIPRWQGEDLQGKRLLIWTEQGLGDSLMMLRYLPLLKNKGAGNILVACQPALTRIMQTLPTINQVIDDGTIPYDDVDSHCPIMSLPYLFGTRLDTIPNAVPYISVPPAMSEKWTQRLAPFDGLKVGLVWAGSKPQKKDSLRSIPFQDLAPVLAVPGVRFVSLQKNSTEKHDGLLDWMGECHDFLDTAALVQQLDLVISVDTAVAHLAGALARPVWLLNRFESEWRWLLEREDSPWYPTMRIFRQPVLHDWGSVIERVAEELKQTVDGK